MRQMIFDDEKFTELLNKLEDMERNLRVVEGESYTNRGFNIGLNTMYAGAIEIICKMFREGIADDE